MANVYRIGMEIIAHNGASGALVQIAAHLTHVHGLLNQNNLALGRFRTGLIGMGAIWAGSGILSGMKGMVDHGAKLVDLQNQMIAAGWKQRDVQDATAKAWQLSGKYQSLGVVEALKMQKELAPALGDRHHAIELGDEMAKFYVSMQGALGSEKASTFTKQIADAVRSAELSGNVLQPERFATYIDGMAKTLKAFSGTLTPSDYFMATKYGRAAAMNWSDDFTNTILPTLIQEQGASTTGTSLMTLYQAVVGGRMKAKSINAFDKLGLIDHSKLNPEDLDGSGHAKRMQPGALVGSRELMENPFTWVWGTLVPAMMKDGIVNQAGIDAITKGDIKDGIGKEARKAITENIAVLFGDRTAQGIVDTLFLQKKKVLRDQALINGAMGLEEGSKFFNERQYALKLDAFHEQWENLMIALGSPQVQTAVDFMGKINTVLAGLTGWVNANPEMAVAGFQAIAVLGGSLVTLGTAAVLISTIGVPGILIALGTAAVAFATKMGWLSKAKDFLMGSDEGATKDGGMKSRQKGLIPALFDGFINTMIQGVSWAIGQIVGAVKGAWKAVSWAADTTMSALKAVSDIGKAIADAILSIPGMVMGAISQMAASIGSAISSALSNLNPLNWFGGNSAGNGAHPRGAPSSGGFQKQNFVPSGAGGGGVIKTAVHLDGRLLAESVTGYQVRSARQVAAAATFDGRASPTPGDFAYA